MIALVEGASRQKTPNEIALSILLSGLTVVFLIATVTLRPFAIYAKGYASTAVLIALLVCLIPTTIGGLLSAIGIAGMDRVLQHNVLAMSGRAVEAAGDVNVLLLDKTGTITLGNRQATEFFPAPDVLPGDLAEGAQLSSLADETPEGRSIVVLAKEKFGLRARRVEGMSFIPFSATTRMSGVDFNGRRIRKGAGDSVMEWVRRQGGEISPAVSEQLNRVSAEGATPLLVADGTRVLGLVALRDIVKSRDARPVRPPARDGDPHDHDHRGQPADGLGDRARGGRGRLPRPGDPGAETGLDPQGAGGGEPRRDDGRRDQRRSRAGPGGRRRRDEHRHAGGARGRQHGGPRLQPDEIDRGRRDRKAAPDDARGADDVLDRQRRGEVLRDPAGHVRGDVSGLELR